MVVYIENIAESAVAIDGEMKQFRNQYKKITPEFAMQMLAKTNFRANIKFLLKEIKNLETNERKYFSEFVIQAIHKRQHDESVYKELRDLAIEFGLEKEFELYDKEKKIYSPSDYKGMVARTTKEIEFFSGKNCKCIIDIKEQADRVRYHGLNMDNVKVVQFNYQPNTTAIYYEHCYNFDMKVLPRKISLLEFYFCDFNVGDNFYLNNDNMRIVKCKNLPKLCRLRGEKSYFQNNHCYFIEDDFEGVESIVADSFNEFRCHKAKKLSANIAFNNVKFIFFTDCNLSNVDELKLCEDCRFSCAGTVLPKKMYIPRGCEVDFANADVDGVEELVFDNAEKVSFKDARKLPKKIDVSKVNNVDFGEDLDIYGVEELVFSNVIQKNKFLKGVKYNRGISYTSFWGMGVMGVTRRD